MVSGMTLSLPHRPAGVSHLFEVRSARTTRPGDIGNSRMRTPGTRGIIHLAGRWGLWLQGALHALGGF